MFWIWEKHQKYPFWLLRRFIRWKNFIWDVVDGLILCRKKIKIINKKIVKKKVEFSSTL